MSTKTKTKTITLTVDRVYTESREVEVPLECPKCGVAFERAALEEGDPLVERQLAVHLQGCRFDAYNPNPLGDPCLVCSVELGGYDPHPLVLGYECRACGQQIAGEPDVHSLAEGAALLRTMWGWRPEGQRDATDRFQPGDYLHATTWILGTPFHVAAIRVERMPEHDADGDGVLVAADPAYQDTLERAELAHEPDGNFMTTKVPGWPGDYVLLIYPHSS